MPICLTPGHLSRGMDLHAIKALRWSGLTQVVHRRFPTHARAVQRSLEDLKELQSLLLEWASRPDRSAAPLVLRVAIRMASAFRFSKGIGFTGIGEPCSKVFVEGGFPGGCFSIRISQHGGLVRKESGITSSRPRTPPEELEDSNLRALFNQGLHRLDQELHLRSWRIVISGLYSPFHRTSDSERIWPEQPCPDGCRTLGGVPEYIFPPIGSRLCYPLSITPFSSSGDRCGL